MSLAESVRKVMEQIGQAQAKVVEGYGGNPPREVADQLQSVDGKTPGDLEWVQKISDRLEEAKAKLRSQLEAEANGQVEDEEEDVDFEAHPWQFKSEYGLEPEKMRALVESLIPNPSAKEVPKTKS